MLRRYRRFDAAPEGPIKSASGILQGLSVRGNPDTTTELSGLSFLSDRDCLRWFLIVFGATKHEEIIVKPRLTPHRKSFFDKASPSKRLCNRLMLEKVDDAPLVPPQGVPETFHDVGQFETVARIARALADDRPAVGRDTCGECFQ